MESNSIIVKQWSFCESCRGPECSQYGRKRKMGGDPCDGVTSKLIPIDSLSKHVRYEYAKAQKSFIKSQRDESIT